LSRRARCLAALPISPSWLTIHVFLLSMDHLLHLFPRGKTQSNWSMHPRYVIGYHEEDPQIRSFIFRTEAVSWWEKQ